MGIWASGSASFFLFWLVKFDIARPQPFAPTPLSGLRSMPKTKGYRRRLIRVSPLFIGHQNVFFVNKQISAKLSRTAANTVQSDVSLRSELAEKVQSENLIFETRQSSRSTMSSHCTKTAISFFLIALVITSVTAFQSQNGTCPEVEAMKDFDVNRVSRKCDQFLRGVERDGSLRVRAELWQIFYFEGFEEIFYGKKSDSCGNLMIKSLRWILSKFRDPYTRCWNQNPTFGCVNVI